MMKLTALVLSFALFSVALAATGTQLYGIYTGFGAEDTETIVYTVGVDPTTGNLTTIVENFVYLGSSATFDGISTFDQTNDIIYYDTDFASAFIFGADVKNSRLVAPISSGADSVNRMEYDIVNQQLIIEGVYGQEQNDILVISAPLSSSGGVQILANVSDYQPSWTTAYDAQKGIYYWTTRGSSGFSLHSLNLANPTNISTNSLPCVTVQDIVYTVYDATANLIYGISEHESSTGVLYYQLLSITPETGACNLIHIKNPSGGIILVAFTYDPTAGTLYASGATNSGGVLWNINVQDGTFVVVPLAGGWVLEDLEADYTN